mmetsp:Transcript_16832/g.31879  ORF Transcript_16832/g.31879 Transcript_16832/m.31879 type:complete len:403 (+) Transcript_16832:392-1600(+)
MKYPNEPSSNGEMQPLMVKLHLNTNQSSGSNMDDDEQATQEQYTSLRPPSRNQHKRQRTTHFKTYCFAVTISIIILVSLITFMFAIILHNNDKSKKNIQSDEYDNRHENDEENQIYSHRADLNLQHIFNSKPPTNTNVGCQGTVLIMPSCESSYEDDNNRCNLIGMERSFYLITLFGSNRRWPVPLDIFVLGGGNGAGKGAVDSGTVNKRQRAVETMMPLQLHYKVKNRSEPACYNKRRDLVKDVASLIKNGTMCGHMLTVTAADEYEIPLIASDLGCGPLNAGAGCPAVFGNGDSDSVWEMRFVYDEYGNVGVENDDDVAVGGNATTSKSTNDDETEVEEKSNAKNQDDDGGLKWRVYGSVVREQFDPLAFSKIVGDYNASNTDVKIDPGWMNMTWYDNLP